MSPGLTTGREKTLGWASLGFSKKTDFKEAQGLKYRRDGIPDGQHCLAFDLY
jgi:hypothetical protein